MRGRRHGADGAADTHVVEHVETRRMNRVCRQNLVARKSILVQEKDRRPGSGEKGRERCPGAAGTDNHDIMAGLSHHGDGVVHG